MEETKTARYFQYYLREDDRSKPFPSFMARIVDTGKEPERQRFRSSNTELLNWLLKLKFFRNNFFLVATDLLILKNYSKGT